MRARRFALASAFATVAVTAACSSPPGERPAATRSLSTSAAQPIPLAAVRIADDLPPLPPGIETAARAPEVVKVAYEFAARHPEVLSYMPCFCGCERMGHRGNEDCLVSKRDSAGRVTEWTGHGMICEVCLDVATQARQMYNAGASVSQIRNAIEARYASPGGSHTPTPMPPPSSGAHH